MKLKTTEEILYCKEGDFFREKKWLPAEELEEKLENLLIGYQEEATTKWSSVPERTKASNQYEAIEKLKKELFGDE